jgi:hypothetical protein
MTRLVRLALPCGLCLFALAAGPAHAQSGFPYQRPNYGPGFRPGLSPYLNIARGGNPAVNYYLGTLPEFDRRVNQRVVRSEILDLERREAETAAALSPTADLLNPLPGTGHPTAFQDTANYFGPTTARPGAALGTYTAPRRRR